MTPEPAQRILVVDDEADITALVAYHLAKAGYRVTTAANGRDALAAAREESPDLAVLDLMLPGVSGYDVLAELRRREETRDIGVILLTARKDEPDRIKGLSLGADDYLPKPFSPQELVLRVSAVLRRLAATGQHLAQVFERFYRADPARARDQGGTGLGLAIVRHLVEAHGGRVEAQSAPGRGKTIRMVFPQPGATP